MPRPTPPKKETVIAKKITSVKKKAAAKKAKTKVGRAQNYHRILSEDDNFYGYLDIDVLVDHQRKIDKEELKKIVLDGIKYANKKSSREILSINPEETGQDLINIYKKKGKELFSYFVRYCGDPASTAFDCLNKHYRVIALENFRNRTIQKERMNSGWRYQHIAKDSARQTGRFQSVSDLNSIEADFNVIVNHKSNPDKLNIYVSIKNRSNTMGGQDWPKAIAALESAAMSDKNRDGPYICVFGIAMERGLRNIKTAQKSKQAYSVNTEVWYSDFFWPFFSNCSYDEIAKAVLEVLISNGQLSSLDIAIPDELIESFGAVCKSYGIVNEEGVFNNAFKLVDLFCGKLK